MLDKKKPLPSQAVGKPTRARVQVNNVKRTTLTHKQKLSIKRQRGALPSGHMTWTTANLKQALSAQHKTPLVQFWERIMAAEVSNIVLDVTMKVVLPFCHSTLVRDDSMQDQFLWFFHGFLTLHQSDLVLTRLFHTLSDLLTQYSPLLWQHATRIHDGVRCSRWWFEIIRHGTFRATETREAVTAFIYQLLHANYRQIGSISRIRNPLIRAFARVFDYIRDRTTDEGEQVGLLQRENKETPSDNPDHAIVISYLISALTNLRSRAESDPLRARNHFSALTYEVENICTTLLAIVHKSTTFHSTSLTNQSVEARADLCCDLLTLYGEAPRMRLYYYKQLYDIHMMNKSILEAAFCQVQMAGIIEEEVKKSMYKQSPLPLWSEGHLVSCLRTASELFDSVHLFEDSVVCENRLVAHFSEKRDMLAVARAQQRITNLYERIATLITQGDVRPLGTYYRVGFYGTAFGPTLDGKEFVYREPDLTQLSEISHRLQGVYSNLLGVTVGVFKDSSRVDRSQLDAKEAKLQITSVFPHFIDLEQRVTHYERNSSISQFSFDTPFTEGGRAHGSVTEQFKRRTILTVSTALPTFLKRLPVIEREEIVLTPIACVIEDISKRTHRLRAEAEPVTGKPNLKTINQVLSGSVNMQVHGGAEEVCMQFLHPDHVGKFDPAKVSELREVLIDFFDACGECLTVARGLSTEETDRPLQERLDEGYDELLKKCGPMLEM